MNTYIAITIGPIYKTFKNVRRTRELWAASFCFSFLMRNINEKLREGENGIKKEDFILPYFEEKYKKELFELKGFGYFPDRLIFKSKEGDLDLLTTSIDFAFLRLAKIISDVVSAKEDSVFAFLKGYFQISYIEKTLPEKGKSNVILSLSPYLDTLEQQNKFQPIEPTDNYLFQFFKLVNDRKNVDHKSFLEANYEIRDANGTIRVESLIEIATRELRKIGLKEKKIKYKEHVKLLWDNDNKQEKDNEKLVPGKKANDTAFLKALINDCRENYPEEKTPFHSYHKYYCIIQGDGDKIGASLKLKKRDLDVQDFSGHLANWAKKTYKVIKDYKGVPIYIGGDDLLCIVPVANGKGKNVFDLIRKIDKIFIAEFTTTIPTLSFGLSMTYYKYPLAEAFAKAYELLKKAKEAGGNRIAAQIIKHSGNEMISVFDKASGLYNQTLKDFLKVMDNKDALSSSITYKLRENEKVFEQIGLLPERVTYFINHLTNSKIELIDRLTDPTKQNDEFGELENDEKFIHLVKETVARVYRQKADEIIRQNIEKISEAAMKEIYSTLRIVKFVKGLDDDKA